MTTTTLKCAWCSAEFDAGLTSCPRCGASADVRAVVDEGGWLEAPGVKDMAEVQFGQSHAQIEGLMVPVVDVKLADGDSVYCTHDKLLWHDGTPKLSTKKSGLFKSMRTGTPLTLMQAHGPGRIAFSDNHAGELIAMPLDPGDIVVSRQHHMLLATGNVDYEGQRINVWYETVEHTSDGNEYETHYPIGYFERFSTLDDQPGLVMLHAVGNVFTRRLGMGEAIDVAPHSLLAWKGSFMPGMMVERRGFAAFRSGYTHYLSARLQGPGTVWIQSGAIGKTQEHEAIHRYCSNTFVRDI